MYEGNNALSPTQSAVYHRKKHYFIGALIGYNAVSNFKAWFMADHTALEWSMLGLLIVDVLFRSVGLVKICQDVQSPRRAVTTIRNVEIPFEPVIATADNVDALWNRKLEHAFQVLIDKYNKSVDIKIKQVPYKQLQDRELLHLRCYFDG